MWLLLLFLFLLPGKWDINCLMWGTPAKGAEEGKYSASINDLKKCTFWAEAQQVKINLREDTTPLTSKGAAAVYPRHAPGWVTRALCTTGGEIHSWAPRKLKLHLCVISYYKEPVCNVAMFLFHTWFQKTFQALLHKGREPVCYHRSGISLGWLLAIKCQFIETKIETGTYGPVLTKTASPTVHAHRQAHTYTCRVGVEEETQSAPDGQIAQGGETAPGTAEPGSGPCSASFWGSTISLLMNAWTTGLCRSHSSWNQTSFHFIYIIQYLNIIQHLLEQGVPQPR